MSAKTLRDVKRTAHLIASAILIAYLYTPVGENEVTAVMVRVMVVPMLVGTGLVMWQMPRLRRWATAIAYRRHQRVNSPPNGDRRARVTGR